MLQPLAMLVVKYVGDDLSCFGKMVCKELFYYYSYGWIWLKIYIIGFLYKLFIENGMFIFKEEEKNEKKNEKKERKKKMKREYNC